MYDNYRTYPCPYFVNASMYMYGYTCPYWVNTSMCNAEYPNRSDNDMNYNSMCNSEGYRKDKQNDNTDFMPFNDTFIQLKDYGAEPFVTNIEQTTKQNDNFRLALWTGDHLQLTLMSLKPGEDIGLEIHPDTDQFIRIEEGSGLVQMGDSKDNLTFQEEVYDNYAFIIPAGKWHNLINKGDTPLKLYSIYAPPNHPYGTVHKTKAIAEAAE